MEKNKKFIVKALIGLLAVGYVAFNFTELKNAFVDGFNRGFNSTIQISQIQ